MATLPPLTLLRVGCLGIADRTHAIRQHSQYSARAIQRQGSHLGLVAEVVLLRPGLVIRTHGPAIPGPVAGEEPPPGVAFRRSLPRWRRSSDRPIGVESDRVLGRHR